VALEPAAGTRVTAIVLAGGPHDAIAALAPGAPNKAFVPVGGKTLVARTIAALRASSRVGRIVAVAPRETSVLAELALADEVRADGATISESLRSGAQGLPPGELVLVAASDLPILTGEAVDEFLEAALRSQADVVYACVERACHEARFADVPHTWAHLRDGTFCGGGCAAFRPRVLAALDGLLERLGAVRKDPLRLASVFGLRVVTRYALGQLSIADAERRATELLGARAAAVVCSHPEIAVNVDRVGDLALAERLLNGVPSRLSNE